MCCLGPSQFLSASGEHMDAFLCYIQKEQHNLLQKIKSKLRWLEVLDKMEKLVAVTSYNLVQL